MSRFGYNLTTGPADERCIGSAGTLVKPWAAFLLSFVLYGFKSVGGVWVGHGLFLNDPLSCLRVSPCVASFIPDEMLNMDIIQLFIEDIKGIPIITGISQEIWLGVQIKAPVVWSQFASCSSRALLSAIYTELHTRLSELEREGSSVRELVPDVKTLPAEAWEARADIHALRRSGLRHFFKIADGLTDSRTKRRIFDLGCEVAELLSLLPDTALNYIAGTTRNAGQWPLLDEFQGWQAQHPNESGWQQAEERAQKARTHFIEGYMRYVLRIAAGCIGRGLDYSDLVQEGVFGLMRAADRFDYRQGGRFATFASNWIWQAISRALADQGRTIRLPVHMYERVQAIGRSLENALTEEDLITSLVEEDPTVASEEDDEDETATLEERTGRASPERKMRRTTRQMLGYCQPIVPLHLELPQALVEQLKLDDDASETVTLADCIADVSGAVELEDRQQEFQRLVDKIMAWLSEDTDPRHAEIVRQRYGLIDGQEQTLEEIGRHYGLTRERVRQIEQRAFRKLEYLRGKRLHGISFAEPLVVQPLPKTVRFYLAEHFNPWRTLLDRDIVRTEHHRLNRYLAGLPVGDLHDGRVYSESERSRQLRMVLRSLAGPAHYITITDQLNEVLGDTEFDPSSVYALLKRNESVFASLGDGVFSLVEWERSRGSAPEPMLPYCPTPLPDPPNQPDAFLESVIEARKILKAGCTAQAFLRALADWAALSWPQPASVCQSVLSSYFLVGVIPYVYHDHEDNPLSPTLPESNLQRLRAYCLDTMSQRLQAMPEFWWLLQRHQPIRVTELARFFVEIHPNALDDVANRLTILAGIGAIQKSSYGRYHLTPLGESLAERWAREPQSLLKSSCPASEEDVWEFAELLLD